MGSKQKQEIQTRYLKLDLSITQVLISFKIPYLQNTSEIGIRYIEKNQSVQALK